MPKPSQSDRISPEKELGSFLKIVFLLNELIHLLEVPVKGHLIADLGEFSSKFFEARGIQPAVDLTCETLGEKPFRPVEPKIPKNLDPKKAYLEKLNRIAGFELHEFRCGPQIPDHMLNSHARAERLRKAFPPFGLLSLKILRKLDIIDNWCYQRPVKSLDGETSLGYLIYSARANYKKILWTKKNKAKLRFQDLHQADSLHRALLALDEALQNLKEIKDAVMAQVSSFLDCISDDELRTKLRFKFIGVSQPRMKLNDKIPWEYEKNFRWELADNLPSNPKKPPINWKALSHGLPLNSELRIFKPSNIKEIVEDFTAVAKVLEELIFLSEVPMLGHVSLDIQQLGHELVEPIFTSEPQKSEIEAVKKALMPFEKAHGLAMADIRMLFPWFSEHMLALPDHRYTAFEIFTKAQDALNKCGAQRKWALDPNSGVASGWREKLLDNSYCNLLDTIDGLKEIRKQLDEAFVQEIETLPAHEQQLFKIRFAQKTKPQLRKNQDLPSTVKEKWRWRLDPEPS